VRIAFWGSERGCANTSNMLLLAVYLAVKKGYRITLLELAQERRDIRSYFTEKSGRCYGTNYIRTLLPRQLYAVSAEEWYMNTKGSMTLVDMIRYLESNMDMVFINLANRTDEEARGLLHNAHLTVVNLKQEIRAFDEFYARYANLSAKMLLLIGNYYEDGDCDKVHLQEKYQMPEETLAVIPNNPEYERASVRGCIERYIRRCRGRWRSAMKDYFLKELEKTAELLCDAVK